MRWKCIQALLHRPTINLKHEKRHSYQRVSIFPILADSVWNWKSLRLSCAWPTHSVWTTCFWLIMHFLLVRSVYTWTNETRSQYRLLYSAFDCICGFRAWWITTANAPTPTLDLEDGYNLGLFARDSIRLARLGDTLLIPDLWHDMITVAPFSKCYIYWVSEGHSYLMNALVDTYSSYIRLSLLYS